MNHFEAIIDRVEGMKFGRESRYDCRNCRDTGFVTILHPEMIQALQHDADTDFERFAAVLCSSCNRTKKHVGQYTTGVHSGKEIPFFGSAAWHIARDDPRAKIKAATYEHRPEGFIEAFAEHC